MEKVTVITPKGVFQVCQSSSNKDYTDVYHNGNKVAILTCHWWDKDALEELIETNFQRISDKIEMYEQSKLRQSMAKAS